MEVRSFLIFKQIPIHFFARARARDISREFPALIPGNGKWRGPGIPGNSRDGNSRDETLVPNQGFNGRGSQICMLGSVFNDIPEK